jgi:hypothetical protein
MEGKVVVIVDVILFGAGKVEALGIPSYNKGDKYLGSVLITKVYPNPFPCFFIPLKGTEKSDSFSGVRC